MSLDDSDPLKFYLRELNTIRPLTKDEETELLQHVQAQDEQAEFAAKRLIEANLSLVVSIAERHRSPSVHMLDLIQEGNKGLLTALESFTGRSGDSFSAHATTCVEDAVSRAIRVRDETETD